MNVYTRVIKAAEAASTAMAATFEGWEPGNVVLDKPRQELMPPKAVLDAAIAEFEKFLKENVRNYGQRLELHLHDDRKLTPYEELFLTAARSRFHHDGDLEFDDSCVVSGSDDEGEYVLCWKWVPNEAVEFPHRHKAHVYYKDSRGVLTHIETDEVIALDQSVAERVLIERHWDDRLDASCVPYLEWEELEMEDFTCLVYKIGEDAESSSEFTVSQHQIEDVRQSIQVLFPPEGYIIEIHGEIWYINKYRCVCEDEWATVMGSATALARCTRCNRETKPYESKIEVVRDAKRRRMRRSTLTCLRSYPNPSSQQ